MVIKVKIHSIVDVITNSSTTIFTDSSNCIGPAKEMIAEFFKAFGIEKDVDEVFAFAVFYEDSTYSDVECDCEDECTCGLAEISNLDWRERQTAMEKIFKDVALGKIEKPTWMKYAENNSDEDDESTLYIYPKDEKYDALAEKITKFLYSTSHEASYNG